jgi:hypothetical protein
MIELFKELAFKALKNPHNPFPETGNVGDIHCFDDEELVTFANSIIDFCATHLMARSHPLSANEIRNLKVK